MSEAGYAIGYGFGLFVALAGYAVLFAGTIAIAAEVIDRLFKRKP